MDRSERQKGWKKDYGFCGTGLAGEKVGRKGEGQAGRIGYHLEGCELRPGTVAFSFFPLSHFFSSISAYPSLPYPRPICPYDLDSRQCGIILRNFDRFCPDSKMLYHYLTYIKL